MSKDINLSNVPVVSTGKIIEILSDAYAALIIGGVPLKTFPSVMLWGAPGVGKSQAINAVKKEISARTGKKCVVTDVRLILFNPIDLRGIPSADKDKKFAVWLKPKIFDMDGSDDVVNILLLDEISAAPQSVQAAAYQLTLDRRVGEHSLPENCVVIAAGNRTTDKSVSYKMPKALSNRLMHFDVKPTFDSWKKWATAAGINRAVIGFLSFKNEYLNRFDPSSDDLAFATPRSWEMVGNVLNFVSGDVKRVYEIIAGLVGTGVAAEFKSWCKIYDKLPDINKIFDGKERRVPESVDALYALISAMAEYAGRHKYEYDKIENSIRYAELLPPDFSVALIKDYFDIEKGYKEKLMNVPAFLKWLSKYGKLLNGNI